MERNAVPDAAKALGVPAAYPPALPEALIQYRPSDEVRLEIVVSDADRADDRRDAADLPADAENHRVHPDRQDLPAHSADGVGKLAGRAPELPDAHLHPSMFAAEALDAALAAEARRKPDAAPSAARSYDGPVSADVAELPASVAVALPE